MIQRFNSLTAANHLMVDKDYLIKIDEVRIDETCDAYFKWKDLNTYIKSLVSRGINMPDAISEPIGCYCCGFYWNKASGGDAVSEDGRKIEFKATSNFDSDLTSFGPKCNFDELVFLRFNLNDNLCYVYETGYSSEDIKKIKMTKNGATLGDYQKSGKRPHVEVIKKIIEPNNLKPSYIFDIRRGVILENN